MGRLRGWAGCVAAAVALGFTACGGGTPTSPTPGGGGGGGTGGGGTSTTTITITAAGVSPKSITVSPGTRVTFVNNNTRPHDMTSDPHPDHSDCTEINQVGFLQPGQSKQTENLNNVRTCGFHDHNQSENESLKGTIVIR